MDGIFYVITWLRNYYGAMHIGGSRDIAVLVDVQNCLQHAMATSYRESVEKLVQWLTRGFRDEEAYENRLRIYCAGTKSRLLVGVEGAIRAPVRPFDVETMAASSGKTSAEVREEFLSDCEFEKHFHDFYHTKWKKMPWTFRRLPAQAEEENNPPENGRKSGIEFLEDDDEYRDTARQDLRNAYKKVFSSGCWAPPSYTRWLRVQHVLENVVSQGYSGVQPLGDGVEYKDDEGLSFRFTTTEQQRLHRIAIQGILVGTAASRAQEATLAEPGNYKPGEKAATTTAATAATPDEEVLRQQRWRGFEQGSVLASRRMIFLPHDQEKCGAPPNSREEAEADRDACGVALLDNGGGMRNRVCDGAPCWASFTAGFPLQDGTAEEQAEYISRGIEAFQKRDRGGDFNVCPLPRARQDDSFLKHIKSIDYSASVAAYAFNMETLGRIEDPAERVRMLKSFLEYKRHVKDASKGIETYNRFPKIESTHFKTGASRNTEANSSSAQSKHCANAFAGAASRIRSYFWRKGVVMTRAEPQKHRSGGMYQHRWLTRTRGELAPERRLKLQLPTPPLDERVGGRRPTPTTSDKLEDFSSKSIEARILEAALKAHTAPIANRFGDDGNPVAAAQEGIRVELADHFEKLLSAAVKRAASLNEKSLTAAGLYSKLAPLRQRNRMIVVQLISNSTTRAGPASTGGRGQKANAEYWALTWSKNKPDRAHLLRVHPAKESIGEYVRLGGVKDVPRCVAVRSGGSLDFLDPQDFQTLSKPFFSSSASSSSSRPGKSSAAASSSSSRKGPHAAAEVCASSSSSMKVGAGGAAFKAEAASSIAGADAARQVFCVSIADGEYRNADNLKGFKKVEDMKFYIAKAVVVYPVGAPPRPSTSADVNSMELEREFEAEIDSNVFQFRNLTSMADKTAKATSLFIAELRAQEDALRKYYPKLDDYRFEDTSLLGGKQLQYAVPGWKSSLSRIEISNDPQMLFYELQEFIPVTGTQQPFQGRAEELTSAELSRKSATSYKAAVGFAEMSYRGNRRRDHQLKKFNYFTGVMHGMTDAASSSRLRRREEELKAVEDQNDEAAQIAVPGQVPTSLNEVAGLAARLGVTAPDLTTTSGAASEFPPARTATASELELRENSAAVSRHVSAMTSASIINHPWWPVKDFAWVAKEQLVRRANEVGLASRTLQCAPTANTPEARRWNLAFDMFGDVAAAIFRAQISTRSATRNFKDQRDSEATCHLQVWAHRARFLLSHMKDRRKRPPTPVETQAIALGLSRWMRPALALLRRVATTSGEEEALAKLEQPLDAWMYLYLEVKAVFPLTKSDTAKTFLASARYRSVSQKKQAKAEPKSKAVAKPKAKSAAEKKAALARARRF
eukprot:g19137.t1